MSSKPAANLDPLMMRALGSLKVGMTFEDDEHPHPVTWRIDEIRQNPTDQAAPIFWCLPISGDPGDPTVRGWPAARGDGCWGWAGAAVACRSYPHQYPPVHHRSKAVLCEHGCGCWHAGVGQYRGPEGVSPSIGPCPEHPNLLQRAVPTP